MTDSIVIAKEEKVIKIIVNKGEGTKEDPARTVIQYWTLKGKLIAEKSNDHHLNP